MTFYTFSSEGYVYPSITSLLGGGGGELWRVQKKIVFDFDILDSRQTKQMKLLRLRISGRERDTKKGSTQI